MKIHNPLRYNTNRNYEGTEQLREKDGRGIGMSAKRQKRKHNPGTVSIVVIVIAFLVVMSIQILKLKQKDDLLAEREAVLEQQVTEEMERAEELEELDLYTRSMEYIKEMANKMGFVFENEIIFKESGE